MQQRCISTTRCNRPQGQHNNQGSNVRRSLEVRCGDNVPEWRKKASSRPSSRKGQSYERSNRRKGRPAWTRSPDDTPLRDGNRDRLIGLLTERAAKTLLFYLSETNLHVFHWFQAFIKANPIPRNGDWDDVSGETFLRRLLAMSPDEAKFDMGRDTLFDCTGSITVDPRQLAQRVMEGAASAHAAMTRTGFNMSLRQIRSQISREFVQDLANIAEENAILLRESLAVSLSLDTSAEHPFENDLSGQADEDDWGASRQ